MLRIPHRRTLVLSTSAEIDTIIYVREAPTLSQSVQRLVSKHRSHFSRIQRFRYADFHMPFVEKEAELCVYRGDRC